MKRIAIVTIIATFAAFVAGCGTTVETPDVGLDVVADIQMDVVADATDDTGSDVRLDVVDLDGIQDTGDTLVPDATTDAEVAENLDEPPYARFINPFIGSDSLIANIGNTFPGPGLPFGMVRLSPDTGDQYGATTFQHCAGYRYSDPLIYGFSHNHLHGTGAPDYGNILVMPVNEVGTGRNKSSDFASTYSKATEKAEAGYYTVTLDEPAVKVELTATTRCGMHRYTWPEGTQKGILAIDYGASIPESSSRGGNVTMAEDGIIEGVDFHQGDFAGRFGGFNVYFAIKFNSDTSAVGTWHDGELTTDTSTLSIPDGELTNWGGWFEFDLTESPVIEMQVCLSYSSNEGARANMTAELPTWDFEATRAAAFQAWEDFVGTFATIGGDRTRKINFYTAVYHSAQMPQIWNDVTGTYQGFDKAVHTADGWNYYTDLSLWDTFRTQQPLIALVWPEVHRDINRSLLEMARQKGNFPKWALAAGDTGSMIGQHALTVIADSYLKGITDFDVEEAYGILKECANGTIDPGVPGKRDSIAEYLEYGYIPADGDSHSVSVTLEYAFNDYCLAELAGALGHTEDEAIFRGRSDNYANLWDPELKFFREKNADATWTADAEDYDPLAMTFGGKNQGYTEGSGWQYRWFAPHDPAGLIELFGGDATFVEQLSMFFQGAMDNFDFMLPQGWYFQGNEPDIHAAYMFINGGRPDLTQKWARWVLDTSYLNEPGGLIGNDDAGTLAAWYVFTATGLYPSPCLPGYFITSPAFDQTTIKLPGGNLVINAPGASDGLLYITSAKLNGVVLEKMWIDHASIVNGGTIDLTLAAEPVSD
jgi:predicted alpha-1,2-mannosidase